MIKNIQEAQKSIDSISVPKIFKQIVAGELVHPEIEFECQKPHEYFELFKTDNEMPDGVELFPLWDTNGESITGFQNIDNGRFIRYWYEDKPAKFEFLGESYQAFISNLFKFLWESEIEDQVAVNLANLLEFNFWKQLKDFDKRERKFLEFRESI